MWTYPLIKPCNPTLRVVLNNSLCRHQIALRPFNDKYKCNLWPVLCTYWERRGSDPNPDPLSWGRYRSCRIYCCECWVTLGLDCRLQIQNNNVWQQTFAAGFWRHLYVFLTCQVPLNSELHIWVFSRTRYSRCQIRFIQEA